ncbi:DUF4173 domain-containing protein [Bifidobacterium sp. ESL0704]|uniref:DUF4153 domain-containing protein n=1 Tax=Bifidobacterium sp. ESL0704 TaxID=2983219 RepID=UPI0023FA00C7|nr:DUF4173 domain-containing protein [Bifidobacterium sp. ESL0704]WEV52388.1 DUF4173 domain-containing protein [Bifidobacterium sp. ESL0704]
MSKDNYTQKRPVTNETKHKTGSTTNPYTEPSASPSEAIAQNEVSDATSASADAETADVSTAKDAINTANNSPDKISATVPPAPLTKADKASLICAIALSLLWCICVSPLRLSGYFAVAGGVALSGCLLAFLGCAWFLRRKQEPEEAWKPQVSQEPQKPQKSRDPQGPQDTEQATQAKPVNSRHPHMSKPSLALLACTVALMLVPAFSQAIWIRALNACALAITLPLTVLSLNGENDDELFRMHGVLHGLGTFITEQFRHWSVLGRVASSWAKGRGHAVGNIIAGAACAILILFIVVPALSCADGNFAWIVNRLFDNAIDIDFGSRLLDAIRFVVIIPLAFSLLFGLRHPRRKVDLGTSISHHHASTATLNTMLAMLDAVYLVFVAIQSTYLFGGVDTLERFGGYAAYARAGFFQLVGVTAINLIIVMACLYLHKHEKRAKSLLTLELVLVASTTVMLVSAVWRMSLYVGKYGLTRLRLLTYWGMVAIAFLLVATAWKLLSPTFELFRVAFFGTLTLWLVFAFIQPDTIIANVDVDGYLNGSIEVVDTDYLGQLPSSAIGPLNRLKAQAPTESTRDAAADAIHEIEINTSETQWPAWGI